jgi:hypothetical protein
MYYTKHKKMSVQKTFIPTHPTNEPILSKEEIKLAKDELIKNKSFPRINRRFVDPPKAGEPKFALFSYIDQIDNQMEDFLRDVKPHLNEELKQQLESLQNRPNILRGVGKIRGAFITQQEAEERAEEIVRDVDSTNSVFTCIVGVPFPLIAEGMSEEVVKIDIQHQTEKTIEQNVRKQRYKEEKEMKEMKRREEELMRNAQKDPNADDQENYITQRVKLAHLRNHIQELKKQYRNYVKNEEQCTDWLIDMKSRHPEFEKKYMEKYMAGRKAAHIPEGKEVEGFMKYMNDPLIKLPETRDETNENIEEQIRRDEEEKERLEKD